MIKTRFCPSPTGSLHVGGLRTALYNYLFCRKQKGKFLLRIEDTDQTRKVQGAAESILRTLERMGLKHDNTVFYQSKNLKNYQKKAQELVEKNFAYYCFCSTERLENIRKVQQQKKIPTRYDGQCRSLSNNEIQDKVKKKTPFVIRQKMPTRKIISFNDLVRGNLKINSETLDDQILLKSDGWPTYHLASVVDDNKMEVTHVIRGEEWLPSTPKHILLYEYFGWKAPQFAHLPLLLNSDKSKLSKRQGDVAVEEYLKKGYLPEALLNFVLLLGWNPGTEKEMFTLEEMVEEFSLEKINKAGAIFNVEKLDWLNGWYIRRTDLQKITKMSIPYLQAAKLLPQVINKTTIEKIEKIIELEQKRIKKLSELPEAVEYFFKDIEYNPQWLLWKKQTAQEAKYHLEALIEQLESLFEKDFHKEKLEYEIKKFIDEKNLKVGDTLWPLRVALCGRKASPGPFEIAEVMGKKMVIERIRKAIKKLEHISR